MRFLHCVYFKKEYEYFFHKNIVPFTHVDYLKFVFSIS